MIKDIAPAALEPFTADEEAALDERLSALSVVDLRKYIESAKSSLGNKALAATWRPRIELGMRHAESALVKGEAAEQAESERAAREPAPAPAAPKSRAKAVVPVEAAAPDDDE